ncbi:hypothetical protein [Novosphingobium terrae]|uniref:hypothetical protein n=1 Tax=Novosphingobium terrae TaxID=2726189 RepID=UPI00197D1595|nr:hypothetical protein [Novosphingobium terrae]
MTENISLAEKQSSVSRKAMGRPPLGVKVTAVRLTPEALGRIDALVGAQKRAQFIREAVDEALERREKGAD